MDGVFLFLFGCLFVVVMFFFNSYNVLKLCFLVEDEFFDLSVYNNYMVKVLIFELYVELCVKSMLSGFMLDDVIQIGVDNLGYLYIMIVGCVVGDEEFYEVFKDFFDFIIEDWYGGYKFSDEYKIDFNFDNLQGGDDLDFNYVLSLWVCMGCSICGFCFFLYCSCGEC